MSSNGLFTNPFRPGAGQMPPYLAGREAEKQEFVKLLSQRPILDNLILTGPGGIGKTVLLESLKPLAIGQGWLWATNDLSEATGVSERSLAMRLLTAIAMHTSSIAISETTRKTSAGLLAPLEEVLHTLDFGLLLHLWETTPGLSSDKLKAVFEVVWSVIEPLGNKGIVFAYDAAQNLSDNPSKGQFPLSLLLDVFQSIQRKGIPFMLVLAGLPTLFPKLVTTRAFAERMFHVVQLDRLSKRCSREAILKPIEDPACPVKFQSKSVRTIYEVTLGYPYFIQFVCREVYDVWVVNAQQGVKLPSVPVKEIMNKLDGDFFAVTWARATDRQRDILAIVAQLPHSETEFTVQEIVDQSQRENKIRPFSSSRVSQLLVTLSDAGLVYKNRWGKYSLAVPMLDRFILRQSNEL